MRKFSKKFPKISTFRIDDLDLSAHHSNNKKTYCLANIVVICAKQFQKT
jgi:hypothetical protein